MSSKFLRMISMILILAFVVSAFAVFAFASDDEIVTDGEQTEGDEITDGDGDGDDTDGETGSKLDEILAKYPKFQLVYQRNFSEGWDAFNGITAANNAKGNTQMFSIDYETTLEYTYNYFMRFTVGSSMNDYVEFNLRQNDEVGTVIEFDVKSDDYTNINGLLHYGTLGTPSTARNNYDLFDIIDGKGYFFNASEAAFDLANDWMHIAIVYDYEYGNEYDYETGELISEEPLDFTCSIYYGPTSEYEKTGELTLYETRVHSGKEGKGKGTELMRIGSPTGTPEYNFGTSVCFDNIVVYNGAKEYGLADISLGYGINVSPDYNKSVEILGEASGDLASTDYINAGVALKVGVDYARVNKSRVAIMEDDEGSAYGAPIVVDGNIMVPLLPILDFINYPYYIHKDGIFVDISTGKTSSYISIGKKSATVDGELVALSVAPAYITDANGNEYLAVELYDFETLVPEWFVDYDDLGLIAITKGGDVLDRDSNLEMMLDVMKDFIFDYPEASTVAEDVEANTSGFDHPYIMATQDTFDRIRAAYLAEPGDPNYDPELKNYLVRLAGNGDYYFQRWAHYTHTRETIDTVTEYDVSRSAAWREAFYDEDGNLVERIREYYDGSVSDMNGGPLYTTGIIEPEEGEEPAERVMYEALPEDFWVSASYTDYVYDYAFYDSEGDPFYQVKVKYEDNTITTVNGDPVYDKDGNVLEKMPEDLSTTVNQRYYEYFLRLMTDEELLEYHGEYSYRESYSLEMNWKDAVSPGYDSSGGRSTASNRTARLADLAYAWVITHDEKLLQLAFEVALRMGEWDHWGPGHFLNCADASAPYAMFIDWTYDAYEAIYEGHGDMDGDGNPDIDMSLFPDNRHYDINKLMDILYEKGVYEGYISSKGILTEYVSSIVGDGGSFYNTRDNNWNAVCSSGMIIASLVMLDSNNEEYAANAAWLIEDNLYGLAKHGMDIYAPDGSYPEGPGYWNYGTNNFFEMCLALDTAAGTNYGMMECWGIDETCYYAVHTESSDGRTFNYADGSMGSQDGSYYLYAGRYFDDPTIQEIRMTQLSSGIKGITWWDILCYPFDGIQGTSTDVSFDYFSSRLDLYASRSSWDPGAVYIAAAAGDNHVATHNQIDGGSFVYHAAGTVWIIDLGTENYNAYGFWPDATRYRYYVMKPEGNNTLVIASDKDIPYGQVHDSMSPTTDFQSNEFGSFVTYDMTEAFGAGATYWRRGFMLTNDRTTTIVQDEVMFSKINTVYWFAHFSTNYVKNWTISADGRNAYLTDYNGNVLRASIVSDKRDLAFEVWDAYTFVHREKGGTDPVTGEDRNTGIVDNDKYTYPPEFAINNGYGVPENDRTAYRKLVIRGELTISFDCAVVFEVIDANAVGTTREPDVGYSFTSMREWVPSSGDELGDGGASDVTDQVRPQPQLGVIASNMQKLRESVASGGRYTFGFEDYFMKLCELYYIIEYFRGEPMLDRYKDEVAEFDRYVSEFSVFLAQVENVINGKISLCDSLMGLK